MRGASVMHVGSSGVRNHDVAFASKRQLCCTEFHEMYEQ